MSDLNPQDHDEIELESELEIVDATEDEGDEAEIFPTDIVGKWTAVEGTAVAMKVTDADEDGSIVCTYVANGVVHRFHGHQDEVIGFGDVLEFAEGVFVDAYDHPDLDEEDEDEEEIGA